MDTANDLLVERTTSTGVQEKRTYTVSEVASMLQLGKSKAYELCNEGIFQTLKIGRAVRISKASFDEWLNNQFK